MNSTKRLIPERRFRFDAVQIKCKFFISGQIGKKTHEKKTNRSVVVAGCHLALQRKRAFAVPHPYALFIPQFPLRKRDCDKQWLCFFVITIQFIQIDFHAVLLHFNPITAVSLLLFYKVFPHG